MWHSGFAPSSPHWELLIDPKHDWIYQISKGKLIHPSDDLMTVATVMNAEFQKYHGSFLKKEPSIFKNVATIVTAKIEITLMIPKKVLLCFIRTRTYIYLRNINKSIMAENNRRKFNKKMSKIINKKIT